MNSYHELDDWADSVIGLWKSQGVELSVDASEDAIADLEKRIGIKFPLAFIELHRRADGFKDWEWNYHMFSIWSLKRIEEEYETGTDKNYVGICDFLISSHGFGFLKNANGIYKDCDQHLATASSFEEIIDLINCNSDLIY